eukprot:1920640-Lingulodinium_polyedra.AAC.1
MFIYISAAFKAASITAAHTVPVKALPSRAPIWFGEMLSQSSLGSNPCSRMSSETVSGRACWSDQNAKPAPRARVRHGAYSMPMLGLEPWVSTSAASMQRVKCKYMQT